MINIFKLKQQKEFKTPDESSQVDTTVIPPNYLKEDKVRSVLINFLLDEIKVTHLDSGKIDYFITKCKAV